MHHLRTVQLKRGMTHHPRARVYLGKSIRGAQLGVHETAHNVTDDQAPQLQLIYEAQPYLPLAFQVSDTGIIFASTRTLLWGNTKLTSAKVDDREVLAQTIACACARSQNVAFTDWYALKLLDTRPRGSTCMTYAHAKPAYGYLPRVEWHGIHFCY